MSEASLAPLAHTPERESQVSGNAGDTQPSNFVHYPALDGVRACAFFLVYLAHYWAIPWGFSGVNIFFVLSGFLITGILYDSRDKPGRAQTFYVRRTLRIFPLYYGLFLVLLITTPLFHWQWSKPWLAWPLYFGNFLRMWKHGAVDPVSFSQTYGQLHSARWPQLTLYMGHFWSLCVEEQFYLLWPWVVFQVRSRAKLIAICTVVILGCPVCRALLQAHTAPWVTQKELLYTIGVPFQLDALLLGSLVALLWRGAHRDLVQVVCKYLCAALAGFLILYFACVMVTCPAPVRTFYHYPSWRLTWGLSLLNLYGVAFIVRSLNPGSLVYRFMNQRSLRAMGRVTYGAYVFHDMLHGPLIWLCLWMSQFSPFFYRNIEREVGILGFMGTFALAALSFHYFESPFLKLKDRLAPSRVVVAAQGTA